MSELQINNITKDELNDSKEDLLAKNEQAQKEVELLE